MIRTQHLPPVVAVHGKKRAGKGTIAEHLVRNHGYVVVKFADPLKDMLRVLLRYCGLDEATIERCIESDLKEAPLEILGGKSTRHAMQTLGTEWRELIDSALWVNIALSRVRAIVAGGGRVVVDDLRFPAELAALEAVGAALWLVTNSRVADGGATGGHASEQGLPPEGFHASFANEGSFEALYALVDAALASGAAPAEAA